jgi:hypothetical protein
MLGYEMRKFGLVAFAAIMMGSAATERLTCG